MKKNIANYLYLYLFIMILGSFISSCKKDNGGSSSGNGTTQLSDADSLKYLMYGTMQVSFVNGGRDTTNALPTYYWYNDIPKLNPLSSTYDSADILLADMKNYAINPSTGNPYDRYSFLDKTGAVAEEIQQGVSGDLGMQVTYATDANGNYYLFVLYADKNSPAGLVGVTRGWQITAINGSSNISYDGSNGPNVTSVVNAVYNDPSSSFTFLKPDGTTVTYTLTQAVYNINPVLFDTVFNVANQNVGYFVFNTFSDVYDSSGNPTLTKTELDRVFSEFEAANVSSVIVDERYNGGGSVETSQYIDSLLAPSTVTGKVLYNIYYNDKLTAYAAQNPGFLPGQVLFNGGGTLNLNNVFFIGTSSTASAAELTINDLKPYRNVKLVGDTTYGKPVGFFAFSLDDYSATGQEQHLADLYAINFETKNANGIGGYFTGLFPDGLAVDYVDVPWGNANDDNLVKIFSYLNTGAFGRFAPQERMAQDKSLRLSMPSSMPSLRFNGMVDYKHSRQLKASINKSISLRKAHK
ncbi:MAG TPA: S41 family peptidase [Hanamia sp.]